MATPTIVSIEKPCVSFTRKPTSSETSDGPVSIPQDESTKVYPIYQVAFIGRTGSGRNSLAWRMNNLNDSELPVLEFLPVREVIVDTATRPDLGHQGTVGLKIRIVPPDELHGQTFFHRHGGINECDVLVFVVDLGDEKSSDEFYTLYRKEQKHATPVMPPFLIVGTKVDQKLLRAVELHRWGENTACFYLARGYFECSAKSSDGVGDVLGAILMILLLKSLRLKSS